MSLAHVLVYVGQYDRLARWESCAGTRPDRANSARAPAYIVIVVAWSRVSALRYPVSGCRYAVPVWQLAMEHLRQITQRTLYVTWHVLDRSERIPVLTRTRHAAVTCRTLQTPVVLTRQTTSRTGRAHTSKLSILSICLNICISIETRIVFDCHILAEGRSTPPPL